MPGFLQIVGSIAASDHVTVRRYREQKPRSFIFIIDAMLET